jgi:hypothetical protein
MKWIWDWRDGRLASGLAEVTAFEPLLAGDRTGSDPGRFLPQRREAGLRVDEGQDEFLDPALRDLKIIGP